jgi:very-short-patch-repair endonuclease
MPNRHYTKQALQNSKELRTNQTDPEQFLWFHLRNRNFNNIKFRRQVPVGDYIVDFLCMERKLVIELDGAQHIDNKEYDERRTLFLEGQGYSVIRINNDILFKEIDNVLEYIYKIYLGL